MTLLQAILLGLIQGITEFLPISSSGHLSIIQQLFHMETGNSVLFDVFLHIGTLLSICVVFYKDIIRLILESIGILINCIQNVGIFFQNVFQKNSKRPYIKIIKSLYRRFVVLIIVSTIPTGILGYLAQDLVEAAGITLLVPGICLLVTSILLLITDRCKDGKVTPKNASFLSAFSIGMAQGIATLPGLSRSGVTITACLLYHYDRRFAVKYSFLMSIPAVVGAAILDLSHISKSSIATTEWMYSIIGMMIASIVGYVCIKLTMIFVKEKKFLGFSIYCFLIGMVAIVGHFLIK